MENEFTRRVRDRNACHDIVIAYKTSVEFVKINELLA